MPGNALFEARRDTRANWNTTNPVLAAGEPGYDLTLKKVKWGDGVSAWKALSFSGEDPNILNPKNYGAKGDGTTADDQAYADWFVDLVAGARNDFDPYGDYRLTKSGTVPPGTYLINGNGKLLGDVVSNYSSGLTIEGKGPDVTQFVFNPSGANGFMMYNNDRLYHITFVGCTFFVTGTNAATATLFKSVSNGHAQSYNFINCIFAGVSKYGLALSGSNNNSEMKFTDCKFLMSHPSGAFLFSPTVGAGGSDQFLNYQFTDCDIEYSVGDFVQLATGGCVNISGGSLIHAGDGSTVQRFVSMLGNAHSASADSVSIRDCRVEHRHPNSQLLYSERIRGNIVIDNVNTEAFAGWGGQISAPQNVRQVEIIGGSTSYPNVEISNSTLMGQHYYHYGASSYLARPNIEYDNCNFVDAIVQGKRAVDYIKFVADGGTTNIAGAPLVRVINCHAEADTDNTEIFDTWMNWHTAINAPVPEKVAFFRSAAGGPAGGAVMKLPLNAQIIGFVVSKGAGGTATGTNVSYTLTNNEGTNVASVGSGGAAWNTEWKNTAGRLGKRCTNDNQRLLVLGMVNITETRPDLDIGVVYIG